MVSLITKSESRWYFQNEDDATLSTGELVVVAAGEGEFKLRDPAGQRRIMKFFGAGAGIGLGIKFPMKFPKSKLFGRNVKNFTKLKRNVLNAVSKTVELSDKAENLEKFQKMGDEDAALDKGEIKDDDGGDSDPSFGIVYVGHGCTSDELEPSDFNGLYVMVQGDLGLFEGVTGGIMLGGLTKLPRPFIPSGPGGTSSLTNSLEFLATAMFPELVFASILLGILMEAKVIIVYAKEDVELRWGTNLVASTGKMICANPSS